MGPDARLSRARTTVWLLVAAVLGGAASVRATRADGPAADAPAIHETLREFLPTSKYEFVADPKASTEAEVYFSARAATYLVRGTALGVPLLLKTGVCSLDTVTEEALLDRKDGGFDLRADAKLTNLGCAVLAGRDLLVDVPGLKGKLSPKPPMLGWFKAANLLAGIPEYARDAKKYAISDECVTSLKTTTKGKVRVFVYFGTWCPTCSTVMGRVLRLEQELEKGAAAPKEGEAPAFQFDYFGAKPEPDTWEEPELKTHGIEILPTGLVYVDGRNVGRISGYDWSRPEAALRRALDAAK